MVPLHCIEDRAVSWPRVNGFQFACQPGCTNCCQQRGFVYLTEDDVKRAAAFLRLSAAEFERQYLFRTRHLRRLRKPRGAQCPFLREGGCAIHPVKPQQCRAFPFWPEFVASASARREAAGYCPGIGAGPLIAIETARATADSMRASYPELYD